MRTIQYGIELGTGLVWSRVGSEVALPVLQYDQMLPENNFATTYALEKFDITALYRVDIKWTRKIPTSIKNLHREFWGFTPLKEVS